jgi:acyl-CoA dehydrogenase
MANLPNRPAAWLLRLLTFPFGTRTLGPSDKLTQACAAILLEPSEARERLTVDLYRSSDDDGVGRLDRAFTLISAARPLRERLRQAHVHDIAAARQRGLINDAEADQLKAVQLAISAVVAVDDFPADEITRHRARAQGDVSSATAISPTAAPPTAASPPVVPPIAASFQSNAAE